MLPPDLSNPIPKQGPYEGLICEGVQLLFLQSPYLRAVMQRTPAPQPVVWGLFLLSDPLSPEIKVFTDGGGEASYTQSLPGPVAHFSLHPQL